MRLNKPMVYRIYSIAGFAFIFAYLLSFLFEGQVLYGLIKHFSTDAPLYITVAIAAHFAGLFTGGLITKTSVSARKVMISAMGRVELVSTMLKNHTAEF